MLPVPSECRLFTAPSETLAAPMRDMFARAEIYTEDSHWRRYLLVCRGCGQHYLMEFYEEIDWTAGDDPQWVTYAPVLGPEQARTLTSAGPCGLRAHRPILTKDFPSGAASPTLTWLMP